jgi:hypothetical protein
MIDKITQREEYIDDENMHSVAGPWRPLIYANQHETRRDDPCNGQECEEQASSEVPIEMEAPQQPFKCGKRSAHQANWMEPDLGVAENRVNDHSGDKKNCGRS